MFFFALAVFLACGWLLPWWSLAAASLSLGILLPTRPAWTISFAAAVAWATLAFLKDGHSHGIISQRMSALFGLPAAPLIFLVMAILGAVTAVLFFKAGASLRLAATEARAPSPEG